MTHNSPINDNQNYPQVFPYVPPVDGILKNDPQISSLVEKSQNSLRKTRFCIICDFPMAVKVILNPCCHYMCYSCYCQNPIECRKCEITIKSIKRLGDYEPFLACDFERCNKYFDNEKKLKDHLRLHD